MLRNILISAKSDSVEMDGEKSENFHFSKSTFNSHVR